MLNMNKTSFPATIDNDFITTQLFGWVKDAIEIECNGLMVLVKSLTMETASIVELLIRCEGRVILTGIGKSGHIAKKIASTFSSTGTTAIFVHPTEASHGDLGMITSKDVVICLSKSGESTELIDILNYCRRFGIKLIGISENMDSTLAQACNHMVTLPKVAEACPLNLAPTTSTTMMLALGDALAVACLHARKFSPERFQDFHPGGKLGRKLMTAKDIMHKAELLPLIGLNAKIKEAIIVMTHRRFGCVGVVNERSELVGIYTDGDLRRQINEFSLDYPIKDLMHQSPFKINADMLLVDVAKLFADERIPSVFICCENKPIGIVHIHDLLQKGFL
jgi:arabinose-5-phosphate isomerase